MGDAHPEEDEASLIRACLAGDDAAWSRLVERFAGRALASVRTALGRRGPARDAALEDELVGDTFATLAQDDAAVLRSFRGESSFGAFVAVIAARRAYREIRSRLRRDRAQERASQEASGRHADEAGAGLEREERIASIAEALRKLPADDAILLTAYYLDELSYREVAALTGGEVSGVGTRIRRARERLREALRPTDLEDD